MNITTTTSYDSTVQSPISGPGNGQQYFAAELEGAIPFSPAVEMASPIDPPSRPSAPAPAATPEPSTPQPTDEEDSRYSVASDFISRQNKLQYQPPPRPPQKQERDYRPPAPPPPPSTQVSHSRKTSRNETLPSLAAVTYQPVKDIDTISPSTTSDEDATKPIIFPLSALDIATPTVSRTTTATADQPLPTLKSFQEPVPPLPTTTYKATHSNANPILSPSHKEGKHRDSYHSHSETESIFDPEPDFEDRFPAVIYEQLITGLQNEVSVHVSKGEWEQAEQSHRKCIEYLMDRERKLGIPFDDKDDLQETMATIYAGKGEWNKAKQILNKLLTAPSDEKESGERGGWERKSRLYHALAEIYSAQDRLAEAEKYAKRAYIGRERNCAKDDPDLLSSVSLLVTIYERQHKTDTAEALRKVYRAESTIPPEVPPKSVARIDTQQSPPLQQHPFSPPRIESPLQNHHNIPPYPPSPTTQSPVASPSKYPQSNHHQNHAPFSPVHAPFSPDDLLNSNRPALRWGPNLAFDSSSINAHTKSGETPLISAIATGDTELVRLILGRGADIETRCADRMTPLMHAVHQSHSSHTSSLSIIETLLDRSPLIDAQTAGWTAFHRACALSMIPVVKMLLARGADIESRAPKEFIWKSGNPLQRMMAPQSPIRPADDLDDFDTLSATSSTGGWTALLRACSNGDEAITRLLIDRGADIEARSPSAGTPLTHACEGRHESLVEFLLQHQADVNAEDDFGWKPIHRCLVTRGGERTAQLLLTYHADVDSRDSYQKTPLHHAVEKGNDNMVSWLLNAGADIESRDIADRTPLHTAIDERSEGMVRHLLDAGADADAMDRDRRDALKAAEKALRRSPEIITLLQKHKKERGKRGSKEGAGGGGGPAGRKISGSVRVGVSGGSGSTSAQGGAAGVYGAGADGRRGSASTASGSVSAMSAMMSTQSIGLSAQGAPMGWGGGRNGSVSGGSVVSRNSSSGSSSWWSMRSKSGKGKR